ncbi:MAG: hypothetical protein H6707_21150 [Deltaproteobacteria bacterium]|nr:hypothetical protein [Deltaproteobacteria bacterium]
MSGEEIILLCNPSAGGRWRQLAAVLDADETQFVRRVVTDDIDDLGPALAAMLANAKLVCIYGGDGTIQRMLDTIDRHSHAIERLPPLALLGGGTMNVTSRWCGMDPSPQRNFHHVVRAYRNSLLDTRELPLLRVEHGDTSHLGFTFGLGPLVRVLAAYEEGRKGKLAAVGAGVRAVAATWKIGPKSWRSTVAPMTATVTIGETRQPYDRYTAVFSSTTGTVNPSVQPFARQRTLETFYCLAYAVHPREFALAIPLLWRGYLPVDSRALLRPLSTWRQAALAYFGKGIVPADPRYVNQTTSELTVSTDEPVYTVDGEVFKAQGAPFAVKLGPRVRLVTGPTAGLGPLLSAAVSVARRTPQRKRPE